MRTNLDATTLARYLSGDYDSHVRIKVANASSVMIDLFGRYSGYKLSLPNVNAPIGSLSIDFVRELTDDGVTTSLAPMVTWSDYNRIDYGVAQDGSTNYSPLLQLGRLVTFEVALSAVDGARPADASTDWYEVYRGYITNVDWPTMDAHRASIKTSGIAGILQIAKSEAVYTYSQGDSIETVARDILDNNGFTSVAIDFPVATGKVLPVDVEKKLQTTVWEQLWSLAQSMGWVCYYRYDGHNDPELSFFEPARTKTTSDQDVTAYDYSSFGINESELRCVGYLLYYDTDGSLQQVGPVVDTDSLAKYGGIRRPFWIQLEEDSPIRNVSDATDMVNAALLDVADPDVIGTFTSQPLFFGECAVDLYAFVSRDKLFDTAQTLAPFAIEISQKGGEQPTASVQIRGKPTAGARTWRYLGVGSIVKQALIQKASYVFDDSDGTVHVHATGNNATTSIELWTKTSVAGSYVLEETITGRDATFAGITVAVGASLYWRIDVYNVADTLGDSMEASYTREEPPAPSMPGNMVSLRRILWQPHVTNMWAFIDGAVGTDTVGLRVLVEPAPGGTPSSITYDFDVSLVEINGGFLVQMQDGSGGIALFSLTDTNAYTVTVTPYTGFSGGSCTGTAGDPVSIETEAPNVTGSVGVRIGDGTDTWAGDRLHVTSVFNLTFTSGRPQLDITTVPLSLLAGTPAPGYFIRDNGAGAWTAGTITADDLPSHTHAWTDLTSVPAYATRWPTWTEVTSKPSTFPPEAHTLGSHSDVTITSVGANELLGYSGGWINRTLAEAGIAASARTITASTGLTGGGDLTTDRSIALSTPVSVVNGGTGANITGLALRTIVVGLNTTEMTVIPAPTTSGDVLTYVGGTSIGWATPASLPSASVVGRFLQVTAGPAWAQSAWGLPSSGLAIGYFLKATSTTATTFAQIVEADISDFGTYFPVAGGSLTGNLGLGGESVTGLNASYDHLRIGKSLIMAHGTDRGLWFADNAYYNSSGSWIRTTADTAMHFVMDSTGLKWYTAVTGTAGSTITSWSQRMWLDYSGYLLINRTTSAGSYPLQVNGTIYISGAVKSSSERWKDHIRDLSDVLSIEDQLALLRNFRNRAWDWNLDHGGEFGVGHIAEEVLGLMNGERLVAMSGDGETEGIFEDWYNPLLITGWQEHDKQLETLESRILALEIENADLRTELEALKWK